MQQRSSTISSYSYFDTGSIDFFLPPANRPHLALSINLKELCTGVDLSIAFIRITMNVLVTVPFSSPGTLPLDVNPRYVIRRALPPA
jgi:hypothetical protein